MESSETLASDLPLQLTADKLSSSADGVEHRASSFDGKPGSDQVDNGTTAAAAETENSICINDCSSSSQDAGTPFRSTPHLPPLIPLSPLVGLIHHDEVQMRSVPADSPILSGFGGLPSGGSVPADSPALSGFGGQPSSGSVSSDGDAFFDGDGAGSVTASPTVPGAASAVSEDGQMLFCPVCRKLFKRLVYLQRHVAREHSMSGAAVTVGVQGVTNVANSAAVKLFRCEVCPYQTRHQSNLLVHRRTHTGERPYFCGACGQRYTQGHQLKAHIRNHHSADMHLYNMDTRSGYGTAGCRRSLASKLNNSFLLDTVRHRRDKSGDMIAPDSSTNLLVKKLLNSPPVLERQDTISSFSSGLWPMMWPQLPGLSDKKLETDPIPSPPPIMSVKQGQLSGIKSELIGGMTNPFVLPNFTSYLAKSMAETMHAGTAYHSPVKEAREMDLSRKRKMEVDDESADDWNDDMPQDLTVKKQCKSKQRSDANDENAESKFRMSQHFARFDTSPPNDRGASPPPQMRRTPSVNGFANQMRTYHSSDSDPDDKIDDEEVVDFSTSRFLPCLSESYENKFRNNNRLSARESSLALDVIREKRTDAQHLNHQQSGQQPKLAAVESPKVRSNDVTRDERLHLANDGMQRCNDVTRDDRLHLANDGMQRCKHSANGNVGCECLEKLKDLRRNVYRIMNVFMPYLGVTEIEDAETDSVDQFLHHVVNANELGFQAD